MRIRYLSCALAFAIAAAGQADKPAPAKPDPLMDFSASVVRLSQRINRAVVQVISTGYVVGDDDDDSGNAGVLSRQRATGTGVVLTPDGYIVTNNHVVQGGIHVRVQLPEARAAGKNRTGRVVDAKVVGVDRFIDIAVLKIEAAGLPYLGLGDSGTLKEGQLVWAFGAPLGLRNSVSMGVVSSVARQIRPDDAMVYIQTDAPINPGNSGGPLVDASGRVMGINTFILSQSGGSEGIGFAIPSNIVRNAYEQIRKSGHVHRGEAGIHPQTITPELAAGLELPQDWGVLVGDVMPEGPAESTGLRIGDVITAVDGRSVENAREFLLHLYRHPVGQNLGLDVLRGAQKVHFDVPLIEREGDPLRFADFVDPEKNQIAKLGILGVAINDKLAEMFPDLRLPYGVIVAARASQSPYAGLSLEPGDVIHALNGARMTSIEALRDALDALKPGASGVLQVERDGRLSFVALEPE
jgi:serine protease Do